MIDSLRGLRVPLLALAAAGGLALGCSPSEEQGPAAPEPAAAPEAETATDPGPEVPPTPDDMPRALVLALASFGKTDDGSPQPLPARLEFLERSGGEWKVSVLDDPESNVFHKAMAYGDRLLTVAGTAATVKLWTPGPEGLEAETLWKKDFGGKFSRMRDVEVAPLFGEGEPAMAVATHDQGVVAVLRPTDEGFEVIEIDQEPDTFVHEIEIGDVDGDGVLEVYATPSEPNRLDGSEQSGHVVRYVPASDEGRVVVADLGERHAKEILVDDVDGDGTDELYVVVEGKINKMSGALEQGVEVRRYDADTDPSEGIVVARVRDRLSRFLTPGDVDGDGSRELVLASFKSGLWLLQPGEDARQEWKVSSIDRDSGGFEHAALLTDLDLDGQEELYVASDKHNEVRRYVWSGGEMVREVIYRREGGGSVFTWNIMPIPAELVP